MNVLLTTDLTVMAVNAVILVIVMCTHRGRAKVIGWLGDILAGLKAGFGFPVLRYLLIEWPLRAITGRWPADQQKITELERSELGTGEPERAPVFADRVLHDAIAKRMACDGAHRAAFLPPAGRGGTTVTILGQFYASAAAQARGGGGGCGASISIVDGADRPSPGE